MNQELKSQLQQGQQNIQSQESEKNTMELPKEEASSSSQSSSQSAKQPSQCQICFKKVSHSQKDYFKLKQCCHRFHKVCLINYIQRVENSQKFNCCPQCKQPYKAEKVLKQSILIESNITCVICYQSYAQDIPPCSLPCNHFYHEKCIKDWMSNCQSIIAPCPYCRKNFEDKDITIRFDVLAKLMKEKKELKQNIPESNSNLQQNNNQGIQNNNQNNGHQESGNINNPNDLSCSSISKISESANESTILESSTGKTDFSILEDQISSIPQKEFEILKKQSVSQQQQQQQQLQQSTKIEENITPSNKEQINLNYRDKLDTITEEQKQNTELLNKTKLTEEEQFQIFVQDLNGQSFIIQVFKSQKVKEFAKQVSKQTNIEMEQLRFSCQGKGFSVQNNPDEFLGNLKIQKNCTVHILLKLKGGKAYLQYELVYEHLKIYQN